jgi:CBS domain-containing protein
MSDIEDYNLLRKDFIRLSPDVPLSDALTELLKAAYGDAVPPVGVVISGDGRFLGFLTLKKLLEATQQGRAVLGKAVLDYAIVGLPSVDPDASICRVIEALSESGQEAVPVIKDKSLEGLIFVSDVFDRLCEVALIETTAFAPR